MTSKQREQAAAQYMAERMKAAARQAQGHDWWDTVAGKEVMDMEVLLWRMGYEVRYWYYENSGIEAVSVGKATVNIADV